MSKLLLFTTILLQWCLLANAGEKKNFSTLSSKKFKDTAVKDDGSNDSNEYLYDLLVYSVTINGTQIKPASKASKQPTNSPIKRPIVSVVATDDDADVDDDNLVPVEDPNTPSPVPSIAASSPTQISSTNNTSMPSSTASLSNSSFGNETGIEPTYSPSPSPSKVVDISSSSSPSPPASSTNSPAATVILTAPTNLDECPEAFDSSVTYHEFDVVSRSSIIYECKNWPRSSYCNSFEPGSEHSNRGWTIVGHCVESSPTQSLDSEVTSLYPSNEEGLSPTDSPSATVISSQSPTSVINSTDKVYLSPSSLSPSNGAQKANGSPSAAVNSITISPTTAPSASSSTTDLDTVKLPRIICDISVAPSLEQLFEQNHTLLVAMTNTLYGIFDIHLGHLYDITGISLSVSVTMNEKASGSMLRLKADFTGSVSFSPGGVPTSIQLIDILLRHFSIEEFTKRLTPPSRARAASIQDPIKVNSVFFSLDGMLIQAGASYDPVRSSPTVDSSTLANENIQLAVGVFVLTAVGFALAMVLFIGHAKRSNEDDDTVSLEGLPASHENNHVVPTQTNATTEPRVEISARRKNPFFGGLDGISDVSSMSESPCTERAIRAKNIAPMTPSLGIAAPNRRYRSGVRVLYVNDDSMDYDTEEWKRRSCLLETP